MWAPRWRQKVSALILLQVQISCQSLSILLLCLCFPVGKNHEPAWGCSSVAGGQWQSEQGRVSPAGHQDCFVGSELLSIHNDDYISQDIPASKAVEIEEDIARMAGELDAAVCW